MNKLSIVNSIKREIEVEEIRHEIKDLKYDCKTVRNNKVRSVIRNMISAKQAKVDRLLKEIDELRGA